MEISKYLINPEPILYTRANKDKPLAICFNSALSADVISPIYISPNPRSISPTYNTMTKIRHSQIKWFGQLGKRCGQKRVSAKKNTNIATDRVRPIKNGRLLGRAIRDNPTDWFL